MAPAVVEAVAGSAAKDFKRESTAARLLGSGTKVESFHQTIADLRRKRWYCRVGHFPPGIRRFTNLCFPALISGQVDTIAKRLMSNQGKVCRYLRLWLLRNIAYSSIDNLRITIEHRYI